MPSFETRLTPALTERYTRSGHWSRETFYSILASRAEAHPDRVAIVDRRGAVTYAELLTRVDRVAAGLHQLGIGAGVSQPEFDRLGLPFDPPGTRVSRLQESIHLIKLLFTQERVLAGLDGPFIEDPAADPGRP